MCKLWVVGWERFGEVYDVKQDARSVKVVLSDGGSVLGGFCRQPQLSVRR